MKQYLAAALMAVTAVHGARAQDADRVIRPRNGDRTFVFSMGPEDMRVDLRRGRLGITVDLRPDAARDTIGARVSGVTPGGPADRAGVQSGDIVTRLNGTRLVADGARGEDDDDRSRPGMRLINLASRLEAGDTVRLDVRRDNRTLTLTFAADRVDMDALVERLRIPGGSMMPFSGQLSPTMRERMPMLEGPGAGSMRVMVSGNGFGDLELVRVTPQLATGLGITEGLLVVSIDSNSTLGLQPGDVITAIAGRRPTSPVHAMRILSSYDAGEAVSFDVMRQRRRTTVNGRVPEARRTEWRIRPNSFLESEDGTDFAPMPLMEMRRMLEEEMPRMRELHQMPRKTLLRADGRV